MPRLQTIVAQLDGLTERLTASAQRPRRHRCRAPTSAYGQRPR